MYVKNALVVTAMATPRSRTFCPSREARRLTSSAQRSGPQGGPKPAHGGLLGALHRRALSTSKSNQSTAARLANGSRPTARLAARLWVVLRHSQQQGPMLVEQQRTAQSSTAQSSMCLHHICDKAIRAIMHAASGAREESARSHRTKWRPVRYGFKSPGLDDHGCTPKS